MRSISVSSARTVLGIVLGLLLLTAPFAVGGESYDYQDYRDAGYFEDGFYDDDWFYDWYDTGFYQGDADGDIDFSRYYEATDEKGKALFEF